MIGPAIRDFDAAVQELDRVMKFLISCGGVYAHPRGYLPSLLLFLLGSGQYIKTEKNGKIIYFAGYFLLSDDLADELAKCSAEECRELVAVIDGRLLRNGPVLYVVEMASKGARKDTIRLHREFRSIRPVRAVWHRPAKNRTCSFEVRRTI